MYVKWRSASAAMQRCMAGSMGKVWSKTTGVLMKKEERIEAARKRIEELRKLISEWTKRWKTQTHKLSITGFLDLLPIRKPIKA